MSLNKKDIITAVASNLNLPKKTVTRVVEDLLLRIVYEVKGGNEVRLYGFGTFTPLVTCPRTMRNPATGEPIEVPAKNKAKFTMSKGFRNLTI